MLSCTSICSLNSWWGKMTCCHTPSPNFSETMLLHQRQSSFIRDYIASSQTILLNYRRFWVGSSNVALSETQTMLLQQRQYCFIRDIAAPSEKSVLHHKQWCFITVNSASEVKILLQKRKFCCYIRNNSASSQTTILLQKFRRYNFASEETNFLH